MISRIHADIDMPDQGWVIVDNAQDFICKLLEKGLEVEGAKGRFEISIVLGSDEMVRDLNSRYRNIDRPTNVLSFPAGLDMPGEEITHLGDVILAFDTVSREAREQNKDISAHMAHLVIHGFLHLMGYSHENDSTTEQMETLEQMILKQALTDV